jgi:hypothetical protein
MNNNQKSFKTPRMLHDVGYLAYLGDYVHCTTSDHKLDSGGGYKGEQCASYPGSNNFLQYRDKKQYTNGCMSENNIDQMCCLQVDWPVGCLCTFNLCDKCYWDVCPPSIQPELDSMKLDLHLSPLGEHPLLQNFHSVCFMIDPSVKRVSATVDQNDQRQGFQNSICFSCYRKKRQADRMVSVLEDCS